MISVGIYLEAFRFFLPRVVEHQPMSLHQVSAESFESFDSKFGWIRHEAADVLCRELTIGSALGKVVAASRQSPKMRNFFGVQSTYRSQFVLERP